MENKNIRYVPRKISHHGGHSGYDLVFHELGIETAQSRLIMKITRWIPEFIAWRLRAMRPQPTGWTGLQAEAGAIPWVMGGKNRLCHFIYGEDTYFFTPLWKMKKNRVIATYHYPPQRLIERVSPAAVKTLDAVIIVSNIQREYFEQFIPEEKIFFIPHHVDTEFFTPPKNTRVYAGELRAVFAGNCLRDFDTLKELISFSEDRYNKLRFDLVIPQERIDMFAQYKNTVCHSGISDKELLEIYQSAHFGIMPMMDCTANNTVLEMMATGLPVIVSDVGGIRDYLDETGSIFVKKGDVDGFSNAIKEIENNTHICNVMGEYNRAKAEHNFSLPVVKDIFIKLYNDLINSIS